MVTKEKIVRALKSCIFGDGSCGVGGGSSSDRIVRVDREYEGFSVDYLCLFLLRDVYK